jgi:hypothetical protein
MSDALVMRRSYAEPTPRLLPGVSLGESAYGAGPFLLAVMPGSDAVSRRSLPVRRLFELMPAAPAWGWLLAATQCADGLAGFFISSAAHRGWVSRRWPNVYRSSTGFPGCQLTLSARCCVGSFPSSMPPIKIRLTRLCWR